MTDNTFGRGPRSAEADTSELVKKLHMAEANIEALHHATRGQENLAARLSSELVQTQSDLSAAPASGSEASLRMTMGRIKRRVAATRRRNQRQQGPPAGIDPQLIEGSLADPRYEAWIELYDTLDLNGRKALLSRLKAVPDQPLISVIFPVYNTPENFLREAIDSVRSQLYENWELCIADDASDEPHVMKILAEYEAMDDRIHVKRRDVNGHISASSNTAISLASGPWLCLMDHDDVLAEHALTLAVLAITANPRAGILYSDEDHIDDCGIRSTPYFKPDFDPLLILGQNYFSHLCMIRSDLVHAVGGFREGYEGSQDWDLVLRVLEGLTPEQIVHVPHVLYHWRVHPDSTASSVSAKPYVIEASRKVVSEHLERSAVPAEVATVWGSSFNRVRWQMATLPRVSVIILPRTGERLARCIESIRTRSTYANFEIILFDDGGFRPPMRQFIHDRSEWLTIIENTADISDSEQRNIAASRATGDVLLFVHDDVEVLTDSWMEEIVGLLSYPGIGVAGVKLLYPDLSIQHAGIVIGIGGSVGHPHRLQFDRLSVGYFGRLMLAQCPSAVSWACMAVRRDAFESVGGFSEEHFTGMFGDVDLCLRLFEAGWRTGWTPHAEMLHYEAPDDTRLERESAVRFDRDIRYLNSRWRKWIEHDPAYNPNLSLAHETFPLAWPPRTAPFVEFAEGGPNGLEKPAAPRSGRFDNIDELKFDNIDELNRYIQALQGHVGGLEYNIKVLDDALTASELRYQAVLSMWSVQLGAPFRWMYRKLKRIK
jgi:GT2 family glycosyltransferase